MNKAISSLAALALSLMSAFAALNESGTITVNSSVTGDILIFSGQSLDLPDLEGKMSVDMEMNHNPATGQITGSADFSGDLSSLVQSVATGLPYGASIGNVDVNGHLVFSAKPVRRGSITSLSGAKFSETLTAKTTVWVPSYGNAAVAMSAKAAFEFTKFDVDTSASPPSLNARIYASSMTAKGTVSSNGRKVSIPTMNLINELGTRNFDFTSELPEDSLAEIEIAFKDVRTVAKSGAISGTADSLLDALDPLAAAYKLTGKRDAKTGNSQITVSGQKSWAKGTSAVLHVNDSLQIQTGAKLKNTLKAYGYTITF